MKKLFISISIIALTYVALPVHAATLYPAARQTSVDAGQEFTVDILMDAVQPINTIETALSIPSSLEYIRSHNGNSIISFWIDRPAFDTQAGRLTFSGLIPGGFSGEKGRLISITLRARIAGNISVQFDRALTHAYLNDGLGTEDALVFKPLEQADSDQDDLSQNDAIRPEAFMPVITRDLLLEDGNWVVVFEAQDKGSGIDHYEIYEGRKRTPPNTGWIVSGSPYILKDQGLWSYVFVKAVDAEGNEYTAVVPPPAWQTVKIVLLYGLLATLSIILCIVLIRSLYYRYVRYEKTF